MEKFVSALSLACVGVALALLTPTVRAADPAPSAAPMTVEQDHQNMMDQLHIATLRLGVDGFNAQAPNAQNTDESKATRYTNLPDPLILKERQEDYDSQAVVD